MGARIFFALIPATLIVVAAGFTVQREIEGALAAARADALAGAALARVSDSDAHLQRALLALERYRSGGGAARYEAEYINQKLLANLALLTAPPGQGENLSSESLERLRGVQGAAERLVAEMDNALRAGPRAAGPAGAARDDYERVIEAYRQVELTRQPLRQDELESRIGDVSLQVLLAVVLASVVQLWMFLLIERNQMARRQAEAVVEQTELQLATAADLIPAMIAYGSVDGALLYHNATFARWLGRRGDSLVGAQLPALFGTVNRAFLGEKVNAALAGQRVAFDLYVPDSASQRTDLTVHFIPHFDARGRVVGYFAFFSDVTEFKQLERLKSEFVTTVSHELRTPLTAMQGALGLVAGGLTGALTDKTRSMLAIALENCERLGRIVTDIIDTERMEANRMDFAMRAIDAGDVVVRAMRQCEPLEITYGVHLALLAEAGFAAPVEADADRLLQVVINLLSNACKFSPRGAVVDVKVEHVADMARISVSDRGPGVPPAFRERLFGRFARFAASDARQVGGSGLGLNISKRFMEAMGGSIGYFERPGGGAVFFVELPLIDAAAAVASEAPGKREV